jgi:hypothetical protein
VTPAATWSYAWLYGQCVLVGLSTGAAAGALTGVVDGALFGAVPGALTGAFLGAFIGTIVALFPSLLGACVVSELVRHRHPVAVSTADVRRDLGIVFATVAAAVNAAGLFAIVAYSDPAGLVVLAVGNAGALPVLWLGRASIVKSWAGAPAN